VVPLVDGVVRDRERQNQECLTLVKEDDHASENVTSIVAAAFGRATP
jgi:hypothetical protein